MCSEEIYISREKRATSLGRMAPPSGLVGGNLGAGREQMANNVGGDVVAGWKSRGKRSKWGRLPGAGRTWGGHIFSIGARNVSWSWIRFAGMRSITGTCNFGVGVGAIICCQHMAGVLGGALHSFANWAIGSCAPVVVPASMMTFSMIPMH